MMRAIATALSLKDGRSLRKAQAEAAAHLARRRPLPPPKPYDPHLLPMAWSDREARWVPASDHERR